MRAHEFLLEYKSEAAIKATLDKYGSKIQDKLAQDLQVTQNNRYKNLTPESLLDLIIQVDPTKNSQYTDWILRQYLSNQFRYIEDISKATGLLSFYEKAKPKLPQEARDINKFKTYEQLDQYVDELKSKQIDTTSNREKERQYEQELISSGQAEIYYNSPDIKIIIPKSQEASCYFGKNTKWCTAASDEESNMFDHYSQDGDLYILLFKKTNTRWQFHFQSVQFMDEKDKALSPAEVKSVGHLFPNTFIDSNSSEEVKLATVKEWGPALKYIENPTDQMKLAAVQQDGFALQFIENPTDQMKLAAVKKDGDAIKYIENPTDQMKLAAVQRDAWAIMYIENPSPELQLIAVNQDGYAIKYIETPTEQAKLAAVKQDGRAIQFIENPSEELQLIAVKRDGRAIKYIENPSEKVKQLMKRGTQ